MFIVTANPLNLIYALLGSNESHVGYRATAKRKKTVVGVIPELAHSNTIYSTNTISYPDYDARLFFGINVFAEMCCK